MKIFQIKDRFPATFLLATVVLLSSCTDKATEIPGTGPVERFKKRKNWVYVYAKDNVPQAALYAVEHLKPFSPGLPLQAANRLYGEPKSRIPKKRGAEYLIYENEYGVIKLGSESTADGHTSFPMYFIPHDRRLSLFFCEDIVRQVDKTAEKQVVMLFDLGYGQPYLHAVVA